MRVNSSRKTLKTACFETLGSSELRDYLAADCGSMTSPDVNALPRWPQSSSWSVSLVRSIGGSSTDYAAYDRPLVAGSCLSLTTTTGQKRTVLQRFSRPPCRSLGASTKPGAIHSGFAIGTCWLACSFDARIERSRLVRQIPLPLSAPGSIRGRRQQSSLRAAMALGGFLLVLFSGMSAVIIGTPV